MRPYGDQGAAKVKSMIRVAVCVWFCLTVLGADGIAREAGAAFKGPSEEVRQGIELYRQNKLDQARALLKKAAKDYPDYIAVPYYLGLIYLSRKERQEAIEKWKEYVSMAPDGENSTMIQKYITLLVQREAEAYAKRVVAEKAGGRNVEVDGNLVAVAPFADLPADGLEKLGQGMAAMISADLSKYGNLKVVGRAKMQALLKEMKLDPSDLADPQVAAEVGRLLGARYVVNGILSLPDKDQLELTSVLTDSVEKSPLETRNTRGLRNKFYELEKEIVDGIAKILGRDCSEAQKGCEKFHTQSLPAMKKFARGLDYVDQGRPVAAKHMFLEALHLDSSFDLARAALKSLPLLKMMNILESEMVSKASAKAPAPDAVRIVRVPATPQYENLGIGAIVGGVVVVGGAAAVLIDQSRPDEGNHSVEPSDSTLSGQWVGRWSDGAGQSGVLRLNLTQSNNALNGTIALDDSLCIASGSASGSVDENRVSLDISSSDADAGLGAVVNLTAVPARMEGSISFFSGPCSGASFEMEASR